MLPPAPGLLSTVTGWPKLFVSSMAMAREAMSTAPPAGNGQIRRMGLLGNVWENATGEASKTMPKPHALAKD